MPCDVNVINRRRSEESTEMNQVFCSNTTYCVALTFILIEIAAVAVITLQIYFFRPIVFDIFVSIQVFGAVKNHIINFVIQMIEFDIEFRTVKTRDEFSVCADM